MVAVKQQQRLAIWLFGTCLLVWLMIMLGGATRLTQSGLSIVEWKPITGIIPPLSAQDWQGEFAKYQASPEYQQVNQGMNMAEFQFIYWMEFAHRLLGRLIGLVFFLPLLYFWIRDQLPKKLIKTAFVVLVLGGMQGAMGWYMVKSGLVKDPNVSHYRLTTHLLLAILLLMILFWAGLSILQPRAVNKAPVGLRVRVHAAATLILITIIYGGFVAGLKAGHIYNTYPLMGGQFLPSEWAFHAPLIINFFENAATVQWVHRHIAVITWFFVMVTMVGLLRAQVADSAKRAAALMIGVITLQVGLGMMTLLWDVPVSLGTLHQGTGVVVLTVALYLMYQLKYQPGDLKP